MSVGSDGLLYCSLHDAVVPQVTFMLGEAEGNTRLSVAQSRTAADWQMTNRGVVAVSQSLILTSHKVYIHCSRIPGVIENPVMGAAGGRWDSNVSRWHQSTHTTDTTSTLR